MFFEIFRFVVGVSSFDSRVGDEQKLGKVVIRFGVYSLGKIN